MPLARLLGGSAEPVPAYNSNGLGLDPLDALAEQARELVAEGGFTMLKVRVGRDRGADDVTAMQIVREAVGPEVALVADYNQGLTLDQALPRCRALDELGLVWIEDAVDRYLLRDQEQPAGELGARLSRTGPGSLRDRWRGSARPRR